MKSRERLEREKDLARKIEDYWDNRSSAFSKLRCRELSGPNAACWLKIFEEHLPEGKDIRILDVGTGAGFFPIILAMAGYDVTGIDRSGGMIREAGSNLSFFGCEARLLRMDAQELDFPDESFDAVISRNLTWTLPDAMQAYREWVRVLKKGGVLMNFDSDLGQVKFTKHEEQASVHADISQEMITRCNEIKEALRISTHRRPEWDVECLEAMGLDVSYEADISSLVRRDEKLQYDNIPTFAVYGRKGQ